MFAQWSTRICSSVVSSYQVHYQLEKHLKYPWGKQRTNGMAVLENIVDFSTSYSRWWWKRTIPGRRYFPGCFLTSSPRGLQGNTSVSMQNVVVRQPKVKVKAKIFLYNFQENKLNPNCIKSSLQDSRRLLPKLSEPACLPPYQRVNSSTSSQWTVWGNMSKGIASMGANGSPASFFPGSGGQHSLWKAKMASFRPVAAAFPPSLVAQ